jgi:hypothetical protein
MFSEKQANLIRNQTGVSDLGQLVRCVTACGFDEHAYLSGNKGLQQAGFDPPAAFFHFLTHGYKENRDSVCGVMPSGLLALSALDIANRQYANQLFRSMFFGQLQNPQTAETLRTNIDSDVIKQIRKQRGIPYTRTELRSLYNRYLSELYQPALTSTLHSRHGTACPGHLSPHVLEEVARTSRAMTIGGVRQYQCRLVLCREKGLLLIDDFHPLLGNDGIVGRQYLGSHGGKDFHLDHAALGDVLVRIIQASIKQGAHAHRSRDIMTFAQLH